MLYFMVVTEVWLLVSPVLDLVVGVVHQSIGGEGADVRLHWEPRQFQRLFWLHKIYQGYYGGWDHCSQWMRSGPVLSLTAKWFHSEEILTT